MADVKTDLGDLGEALRTYIQVATDERTARNEYEGCSWDYYGGAMISEVHRAESRLAEALNAYIDARIEARLPTPI